ncbi:synaptic vesicle glycoprotein 2B isoform X2 [Leptinotarsa decemlineata]|uniref:synaptic vesicle glycoprotein 2B isoform X2 n=1 Tax=Leptinotarsa decemlineata TaxID=7539 RepID=UPI003D308217
MSSLLYHKCNWGNQTDSDEITLIYSRMCLDETNMEKENSVFVLDGPRKSDSKRGMISSGMIWGFLFDTLGRKKLMVYGYFFNAFFVFGSAFSQSKLQLMICKFLGGVIINGPFAAMATYLAEFHSSKYRSMIQMINGGLNSVAQLVLPLMAWGILPLSWKWSLFNGFLELHSWNLLLFICGLSPFVSGIIYLFLPESPKFLMSMGDNDKALKILQMVYSINTGKPRETFPIKKLVDETKINSNSYGGHVSANRSKMQALAEGYQQLKPLFRFPYVTKFLLVGFIQMLIIQSLNMLRLWIPQMFQAIEDYQMFNNGSSDSLCSMMEVLKPKNTTDQICLTNVNNASVYINSSIVALVSVSGYFVAVYIIRILGKKKVLIMNTILAAIVCCCLYFSQGTIPTIALSSAFVGLGNMSGNVMLSIIVDLFPTTLRTFTVAIVMCWARAGAMGGNLLVPTLLNWGCAPLFLVVGGFIAGAGFLGFLLPNTENKPLI